MPTQTDIGRDCDLRTCPANLADSAEQLARDAALHPGEYVARSWDGRNALAYAADELELERRLHDLGIDPATVVIDYVGATDEAEMT
jgi:pimeloyl-ACP methyl ester carboxylesterase